MNLREEEGPSVRKPSMLIVFDINASLTIITPHAKRQTDY